MPRKKKLHYEGQLVQNNQNRLNTRDNDAGPDPVANESALPIPTISYYYQKRSHVSSRR